MYVYHSQAVPSIRFANGPNRQKHVVSLHIKISHRKSVLNKSAVLNWILSVVYFVCVTNTVEYNKLVYSMLS